MDNLVDTLNHRMARKSHQRRIPESPFYSRAYGGYTAQQERFCLDHVPFSGATILDPMAGHGILLANLAYKGAHVWLGDINPALCLLSSLRSPKMLRSREGLAAWVSDNLDKITGPTLRGSRLDYADEWIPENIKTQLHLYREVFDLSANPFRESDFWSMSLKKQFAAALPILAARDIACFRSSDNLTWMKPGGLQRELNIREPLKRALTGWLKFAQHKAAETGTNRGFGELLVERMNATDGDFGSSPKVAAVVTSPPYANRLDYTRMWGPESQVAAALWDADIADIQLRQIGSNVVRGTVDSNHGQLPKQVLDALTAIKDDADYASETYYYPFFRNYASSLATAVQNISARLTTRGVLVIFVRDTVRKDVLFPTGLLVEAIMQRAGFRIVGRERKIVKRHVGFRRRNTASGLYGVGQQEWWLAFRRSST
jgi:DNA modification methylase